MAPPQEAVRRPQAQSQVTDQLGELLVLSRQDQMIDLTDVFAMDDVNV